MLFSNEHFALTFRVRGEDQSQEEAANQCTVTWNGCAAVRLFDCIAAVSQICTVLHFWFILSFWFFLLRRSLSIDYGHLLPLLCGISIIFEFVVILHIRTCFPFGALFEKDSRGSGVVCGTPSASQQTDHSVGRDDISP